LSAPPHSLARFAEWSVKQLRDAKDERAGFRVKRSDLLAISRSKKVRVLSGEMSVRIRPRMRFASLTRKVCDGNLGKNSNRATAKPGCHMHNYLLDRLNVDNADMIWALGMLGSVNDLELSRLLEASVP
jgi:hypothetical protein